MVHLAAYSVWRIEKHPPRASANNKNDIALKASFLKSMKTATLGGTLPKQVLFSLLPYGSAGANAPRVTTCFDGLSFTLSDRGILVIR